MGSKAGWDEGKAPIGRAALSPEATEVIERAGRLTRDEVVRLDLAERRGSEFRGIAWDLLRDQLDRANLHAERLTARNDAWTAVAQSLAALDLEPTPDDGYWRVAGRVGSGAARAARFAACALVAPDGVEPDVLAMLLEPWLTLRPRDVA
jgi:hypothetical protein